MSSHLIEDLADCHRGSRHGSSSWGRNCDLL